MRETNVLCTVALYITVPVCSPFENYLLFNSCLFSTSVGCKSTARVFTVDWTPLKRGFCVKNSFHMLGLVKGSHWLLFLRYSLQECNRGLTAHPSVAQWDSLWSRVPLRWTLMCQWDFSQKCRLTHLWKHHCPVLAAYLITGDLCILVELVIVVKTSNQIKWIKFKLNSFLCLMSNKNNIRLFRMQGLDYSLEQMVTLGISNQQFPA